MDNVYIGKIVSTHGIKGEIRIISEFPFKEKAFQVGSFIIIENEQYKITSYRKHKNYDMITLDHYTNINDVLFLMKKEVYKEKETLNLAEDEVLDSELLEYKVIDSAGEEGSVKEVFLASPTNKILRVEIYEKEYLIPFSSPFLKKIDYRKKEIIVTIIKGM